MNSINRQAYEYTNVAFYRFRTTATFLTYIKWSAKIDCCVHERRGVNMPSELWKLASLTCLFRWSWNKWHNLALFFDGHSSCKNIFAVIMHEFSRLTGSHNLEMSDNIILFVLGSVCKTTGDSGLSIPTMQWAPSLLKVYFVNQFI